MSHQSSDLKSVYFMICCNFRSLIIAAQTVIAAEQARVFLQGLLALSPLEKIGSVSGVWDKLQDFAGALRRWRCNDAPCISIIRILQSLILLSVLSFLTGL